MAARAPARAGSRRPLRVLVEPPGAKASSGSARRPEARDRPGGRDGERESRGRGAPALRARGGRPEERRRAVLDDDPGEDGRGGHDEVAPRDRQPRRGGSGRDRDERRRVERQDREPAVPDAREGERGRGEVAVRRSA